MNDIRESDTMTAFSENHIGLLNRIAISKQRKELSTYLNELPINDYVKEQKFIY